MEEKNIPQEVIELVLARLDVIPDDALMSIGSYGQFDKTQLKNEVKNQSDIGKTVIELQLEYLRLLKNGLYYGKNTNH